MAGLTKIQMFKKFLKFINSALAKLFKEKKTLQSNTDKVLYLVNHIKYYVNNPAIDIIVAATPTTDDDKLIHGLREVLDRAAKELGIVADGVVYEKPEELLLLLREYLQKLTVAAQKGTLRNIAVVLLKLLEKEISTTDASLVIAAAYYEFKNNNPLATE